jgi:predicted amidohydrolase
VVCLQEIFFGPYFCAEQDPKWFDTAEPDDAPTVRAMRDLARTHSMVLVVPFFEKAAAGVFCNTAVVVDADGSVAGKYRKTHIPQVGPIFWEKYFFKPGNLGYPVVDTKVGKVGVFICYDRHLPEPARMLGLHGAELTFNPSATVESLSRYLWELEQPAHAVANGFFVGAVNRVGGGARRWRALLRVELLLRPAWAGHRPGFGHRRRGARRRPRPRDGRRGADVVAVLPRPQARDVQRVDSAAPLTLTPRTDSGSRRLTILWVAAAFALVGVIGLLLVPSALILWVVLFVFALRPSCRLGFGAETNVEEEGGGELAACLTVT